MGEFAFGVVAVAVVDRPPVVDHGDGVQVGRDLVGVVGFGVELGEVGEQSPGRRRSRSALKVTEYRCDLVRKCPRKLSMCALCGVPHKGLFDCRRARLGSSLS